jgi:sarcosine oxidase subunit alpha
MAETVRLTVNGKPIGVPRGTTVAAAVMQAGECAFRRSVRGQPRGPLCGMGICFECRVTVNGFPHVRSCQQLVEEGIEVRTDV